MLALGRVTSKGQFILNLSNDAKILEPYLFSLDLFLPQDDKLHKKFGLKVSDPRVKVRLFGSLNVREPGSQSWIENVALMNSSDTEDASGRIKVKLALIYSNGELNVNGEVVDKITDAVNLTTRFDVSLPRGWSFWEETTVYEKKGNTIITYRSVDASKLNWRLLTW